MTTILWITIIVLVVLAIVETAANYWLKAFTADEVLLDSRVINEEDVS
ncbi:hypothetical protein [Peribacillus alkalitolerans]|nr:hypothetical protein [Peribacillus alkalitolerans]